MYTSDLKLTHLKQIDFSKIEYDKKITYDVFRKIVLSHNFTCIYNNKLTVFTYDKNNNFSLNNVILLTKTDFTQLLLYLYVDFIKDFVRNTRKNAKSVKTFNFKLFKILSPIILAIVITLICIPQGILFRYIIILYYSICVFIKSVFLIYGSIKLKVLRIEKPKLYINNIPKYTILVPMFKENQETIQQTIKAINNIDYPKNLLDVKLVLEEDDVITTLFLKNIELPNYITPMYIPYFEPRTKPKACNIASLFAEGEILVVFDAEDIPNNLQLLYAVETLNLHKNVDILQGCLNFYNYHTNILTELFNVEYNIWFRIALRIFAHYNITIPLGGTSNHIKYKCLEKHGFWDSYNVTEDLELSFMANENNIKIWHLNIETKEWCVVNLKAFIKQRTRWIKGYLLTYLLHLNKKSFFNLRDFIFMHIIVGFGAFSFLLTPFLFISAYLTTNFYIILFLFLINNVYYFTYIFLYYALIRKYKLKITYTSIIALLIYPCYFILHIISAWLAFIEIFYRPFYWAKTNHLDDTKELFAINS